jgi:hypothetical protein
MVCPKLIEFFFNDFLVNFVTFIRKLKRKLTQNECEEDYSKCEDIRFSGVVLSFRVLKNSMNFGRHIASSGTFVGLKFKNLTILKVTTCESEVSELEVGLSVLATHKYVFEFKISMNEIVTMDEGHCACDLLEEAAHLARLQLAVGLEKIEKTSVSRVLQHQHVPGKRTLLSSFLRRLFGVCS